MPLLIGRSVFVYLGIERFTHPIPGIVTNAYADKDDVVDVETFHPKSSAFIHTTPFERVVYVTSAAEAEAAWAKGAKSACSPYDPANPVPLGVEEPKPKPKK